MCAQDFHRTLPRLEIQDLDLQQFMQTQQIDDSALARKQLLLSILTSDASQDKTLVFAKSVDSANDLYDFLQHHNIECLLFHKEISRDERQMILRALNGESDENQSIVVVCTDIAARGLDTTKVCSVYGSWSVCGDLTLCWC